MTESVTTGDHPPDSMTAMDPNAAEQQKFVSRKDKRKALKKDKRKQIRKEIAEKSRAEEEARTNDPEEQRKIEEEEERQKERLERERKEFEERERKFLEELEMKKKKQVEEEQMNAVQTELKEGAEEGSNEDDEWEYVEEGPPEIIWQGNEIIVKKNKVKVKKKDINQDTEKLDTNRPTSNPLPPQSDAYAAYKNAPMTSADLLDTVAQQVPNFGTEQDKAHCPFHIKTGACRFGSRCNRVHYYPDKSTTLLIKNMYNGPGLAWEQDEGLEYTDEEVERSFEDFYDDVHTEFLKFGEIVNFKVCRNCSFHLRGNVYVHYKSLDSAVMACNSVHGRYFAGKQVKCEFVSLTRWKVAVCGEYMKSRLKTCSRGSACNFLHCFSNPGGDYEWADCDKPPPRYWVKKMIALFGYSDHIEQSSPKDRRHSSRIFTSDRDSYHYKRHQSVETDRQNGSSSRGHHEEDRVRKSRRKREDERSYKDETEYKNDTDSDGDWLNDNTHKRHRHSSQSRSIHNSRESKSRDYYGRSRTPHGSSSDEDLYTEKRVKRRSRDRKKAAKSYDDDEESDDAKRKFGEHKSNSSRRRHRRSRIHNHDEDIDEADPQESKIESLTKKPKKHNTKPTTDKDAERRSWHKEHGSRSRDSVHIWDKNDRSDRWDPDSSPNEHARDYQIFDDRKRRDERSSRETRSSSLEEESEDCDNGMREKRKRI